MSDRFANPEILVEGGTSRLIRALDQTTGKEVVIRVFNTISYEEWQALVALLSAICQLRHPNIERIDEVIQGDGEITVVTEIPEGESLSKIVTNGPLSVGEFSTICHQLLDALSSAHDQGIVHGSLNADSIIIKRDGGNWSAKVTGYGRGFDHAGRDGEMDAYLCVPPEQWEQQPARRRSDVYSLGCILYLALAGRSPFDGKTLKIVRHKHINHDLRPLKQLAPQAPDWICGWVMSLIEAAPEKRPNSAAAALDEYRRAELACAYPAPGGAAAMISNLAATAGYAPVVRASTYHVPTPTTIAVGLPAQARVATASKQPQATPAGKAPAPIKRPPAPARSQPKSHQRLILGVAGLVVIALTAYLISGRKNSDPIKVVANPVIPTIGNSQPSSNVFPGLTESYPPGRPKPPNYDQLVAHFMGDVGVFASATAATPSSINGSVMAWRDYAERGRDTTLRQGKVDGPTAAWVVKKPDITFPLAREHRFIHFSGKGAPSAALNVSADSQAGAFPFGSANSSPQRGLTFALVIYQEVTGRQMTVLHMSSSQGSAAVRFGEKGDLRLNLRVSGIPEPEQPQGLQINADKFNPVEPLLVTGFWRSSPPEAQLRVRDGSGRAFQTPLVKTPLPKAALINVLVGRDHLPGTANKNQNQDPKSLRAFAGGLAEVLIYASSLSEADLTKLEAEMTTRYFPPAR